MQQTTATPWAMTLAVSPHDPLIARDGRPFGFSNSIHCLDWPYPSVLAGTVRRILGNGLAARKAKREEPLGKEIDRLFADEQFLQRLKEIRVLGVFPLVHKEESAELFFPAPRDLLVWEEEGKRQWTRLTPKRPEAGEGCNLPVSTLWPIGIEQDGKPLAPPAFWSLASMVDWLKQNPPTGFVVPRADEESTAFLPPFAREQRMNVQIDRDTSTSEEGRLFTTEGLAIPPEVKLAMRVESEDSTLREIASQVNQLHPLGGERRLAAFSVMDSSSLWDCPPDIVQALSPARAVRLVLASPALFDQGWLPGWLQLRQEGNETYWEGSPPPSAVKLRLRGASIGRWLPVSGWDLQKRGPKPARRLVPAGSVYFFEVVEGAAADLGTLWLRSVSDAPQDRNDGFGLALWGVWHEPSSL